MLGWTVLFPPYSPAAPVTPKQYGSLPLTDSTANSFCYGNTDVLLYNALSHLLQYVVAEVKLHDMHSHAKRSSV